MAEEVAKPRLGRGLAALIGEVGDEMSAAERVRGQRKVPIEFLRPNPRNPRKAFEDDELQELTQSIRDRGIIQPIVVRPLKNMPDAFEIVAGERRWRAAQRAAIHEVPVIVREFSDVEAFEVALLENIQRQDLNAIEEAEAYKKLIEEYGHTQEELGRLVHKSRSHIANLMRLLDLPARVRALVATGAISMGHARAIVSAPDPEALADEVMRRGLSVRETERAASAGKPKRKRSTGAALAANADLEALERQLGDMLGLKVRISYAPGGGTVALHYSSLDQLDMICQRLSGERI
jgi:ParB family transcriptional regulator, chromosome partitioning protein